MTGKKGTVLYCFSPPVMIATMGVEAILAIYTFVRYRMDPVVRLIMTILVLLAAFQLAEFRTCGNATGWSGMFWSRFGYVAITLLPPLAIHLTQLISGKRARILSGVADVSAVGFALVFAFLPRYLNAPYCGGNYVVFALKQPINDLYSLYYLGLLAAGVILAFRQSRSAQDSVKSALNWIIVGYGAFLIPTGIANAVNPATRMGIPSIMCGFAVIFAVILVTNVLPRTSKNMNRSFLPSGMKPGH